MNENLDRKIALGLGMTLALLVIFGLYWLTEPGRQRATAQRQQETFAERGAERYVLNCAQCHGDRGQGGFGPPLAETRLEEDTLTRQISRGSGSMPAFAKEEGGALNKYHIQELVTFLRHWDEGLLEEAIARHGPPPTPPPPPPVTEVPPPYKGARNPSPWGDGQAVAAGRTLYQQRCQACHGPQGNAQAPRADFSLPAFPPKLEASPDYYLWAVSEGRPGTIMPPFKGALSEEQRWQVLTFLGTLAQASTPGPGPTPGSAAPTATPAPPPAVVPAPYAGARNPLPWQDKAVQQTGLAAYGQLCQACHGPQGNTQAPRADFSLPAFPPKLEASPDYYFWAVSEGRPEKGMPPFKGALSEEQRWRVLTYLWSLGKEGR